MSSLARKLDLQLIGQIRQAIKDGKRPPIVPHRHASNAAAQPQPGPPLVPSKRKTHWKDWRSPRRKRIEAEAQERRREARA